MFRYSCNVTLIWLRTSHSAIRPLARDPRVIQQLDSCACLFYRLRYELLERHARRAQRLLHCTKMTQHSTQEADVRRFCAFCVLQQTFPDAYEILVSCLPDDMSPDPTKSRPCLECMPHLPSASLGAQSQPAIKKQQTIISNLQQE